MRPARPYFEFRAAHESFWIWNSCFSATASNTRPEGNMRPEDHMRPARRSNTAREHQKNLDFQRNLKSIIPIFQNHWVLAQIYFFIFSMLPERSYFESHAACKSLWVWDSCLVYNNFVLVGAITMCTSPVGNFINILRALFPPISFCQ